MGKIGLLLGGLRHLGLEVNYQQITYSLMNRYSLLLSTTSEFLFGVRMCFLIPSSSPLIIYIGAHYYDI